ncbi:MAG: SOS response-associated peptidase [Pseudomonadales bacterium]|nr:SOS response-associated peptidase [Gammaproteobacteria bacterium]NNL57511.1 SOS response-associated peptidase [Pseudomonadales bacterium]
MCGRFNTTDSPQLQALLDELNIDIGPVPTRYNIAPTEQVLTLFAHGDEFKAMEMRWWLTPHWAREPSQKFAMFNARAETVASSKAFAAPFKRRRAIVPASSFIEWHTEAGKKQAYLVACEQQPCLFAAIWEHWQRGENEIYSCAIITASAVPQFQPIHDRQPVLLSPQQACEWLQAGQASERLDALLQPALPAPLLVTPISNSLNNARHKNAPEPTGIERRLEC